MSEQWLFMVRGIGAEAVLGLVAGVLGSEVDELGTVAKGDLGVLAFPADGDDGGRGERLFGFGVDAMLALTYLGPADDGMMSRAFADVLRATRVLEGRPGTDALLLEELNDSSLILSIVDGELTLNEEWPGWLVWPHVLEQVANPRFERLRLRR
jgi:hypothetical protein